MGNHGQTTSINGVVGCHLVWSVDTNSYQEIQKSIRQINRSTFPDRTVWLNSRYATANGNITNEGLDVAFLTERLRSGEDVMES